VDRLRIGYRVCNLRDQGIGSVTALSSCCFEITKRDGLPVRLTQDALFTVENERVTLVCGLDGLERYLCPEEEHLPQVPTQ
jgi:hypothetical protein